MVVGALAEMSAAILAGGLGTRLQPVLADRPKVLAEVHGRPFLAYLLDQVAAAGVREVVMCTGHLGKQVRHAFGDRYGKLHLLYSAEPRPLDTAGALRLALPLFKSHDVVVMNGDSFYSTDLQAAWEWHAAHGREATVVLTKLGNTGPYGRVRVAADGTVLRFEEKGSKGGPGWINAGIYFLARSLLLEIPTNRTASLEREMFPAWVGQGLYGYRSKGRFLDIGTPQTYQAAEQFLRPPIPDRKSKTTNCQ